MRMGELWLPQLARQMATIDQMLGGRLTINIISSDRPGERLDSEPRYRRTVETMTVLRTLLDGRAVDFEGEFPTNVTPWQRAAETFAVAWRRRDRMPRGAELPWLYGVARRVLAEASATQADGGGENR